LYNSFFEWETALAIHLIEEWELGPLIISGYITGKGQPKDQFIRIQEDIYRPEHKVGDTYLVQRKRANSVRFKNSYIDLSA
jgi:hypothetical protein